jgi:hypothetical protein
MTALWQQQQQQQQRKSWQDAMTIAAMAMAAATGMAHMQQRWAAHCSPHG